MSKSKGNTVEPWEVLDTYGADAFRWYFFTSKQPWDGYRFSVETIGEGVRLFLKQLWCTYYFYVLYALAAAEQLSEAGRQALAGGGPRPDLDRWALSRAAGTAELVAERLDAYDATPRPAGRSRSWWRSSRTGTCAARAGASGTATPPRLERCASCLLDGGEAAGPLLPVHRR